MARIIVNVQPVPFDDHQAAFTSQPAALGITTDYTILNRFFSDLSRWMCGLTSPSGFNGASAAFFQLARPQLIWVCDWTALRIKTPPDVPDPDAPDPNWKLLWSTPAETPSLEVLPDGVTAAYRISGTYVYGHRNPDNKPHRNIFWARPPFLEDRFTRSLSENHLVQGLSSPSQPPEQGFIDTGS